MNQFTINKRLQGGVPASPWTDWFTPPWSVLNHWLHYGRAGQTTVECQNRRGLLRKCHVEKITWKVPNSCRRLIAELTRASSSWAFHQQGIPLREDSFDLLVKANQDWRNTPRVYTMDVTSYLNKNTILTCSQLTKKPARWKWSPRPRSFSWLSLFLCCNRLIWNIYICNVGFNLD